MTDYMKLTLRLHAQLVEKEYVLCAVDGRSGANKFVLTDALQRDFGCTVIRMDNFPLRPDQYTPQRMREAGGGVDHERFRTEVLGPLRAHLPFCYRPFDRKAQTYGDAVPVLPARLTVVEGVYACHPALRGYYDLRVFLDGGSELQKDPAEQRYFTALRIPEHCDLVLHL